MEQSPQSFDVCIVCALPEEARAFLEVVQQQYEVAFEKRISTQYKYDYQLATIKNDKDEPLNLHVSWLPRYGPQEMTLHLSHVLEECQPRIAIMTGICAGDAQHVQLGDLVVAERTFTYDAGKFTLDDAGRRVHLHDTMTYQLDANILQFLGLFDEWKPLVARLPPPPPEIGLKWPEVRCHIKPMASGSAVRTDNPFEDVQAPVRGTIAIDMEGAAFGLVMNRHPLTRWLVVKGVCDYADRTKSDAYHDYAARTSALYALGFIRAYVTHERLPRPDGHSPSSRVEPPGVWNVPDMLTFCQHQVNSYMEPLKGSRNDREKKYIEELYEVRKKVANDLDTFTRSASLQFVVTGDSGSGKSCWACHSALTYLNQGFAVFFYRGSDIEGGIFKAISEDLNWSFSPQYDEIQGIKQLLEYSREHTVLLFVDGLDEIPIRTAQKIFTQFMRRAEGARVKLVMTCKTDWWENLLRLDDANATLFNSRVFRTGDESSGVLSEFDAQEFYFLLEKYRAFYQYFGPFEDEVYEACKQNPFLLRIMFEVAAGKQLSYIGYAAIDFYKEYFRKLSSRFEQKEVIQRTLTTIAQALYKHNTEELEFDILATELRLPPTAPIPESLFELNVLERIKHEETIYISFYFKKLRDYLIAFDVLKWQKLSPQDFQSEIKREEISGVRLETLNLYYSLASDEHKRVLDGTLYENAREYVQFYQKILNEHFPVLKEAFLPYTSGSIGFVGHLDLSNKVITYHGFRSIKETDQPVLLFPRKSRSDIGNLAHMHGSSRQVWRGGSNGFRSLDIMKEVIWRELEPSLQEIIKSGMLDESLNEGLLIERVFVTCLRYYKDFFQQQHPDTAASYLPLDLKKLKEFVLYKIAHHVLTSRCIEGSLAIGTVEESWNGPIRSRSIRFSLKEQANLEERAWTIARNGEDLSAETHFNRASDYGKFLLHDIRNLEKLGITTIASIPLIEWYDTYRSGIPFPLQWDAESLASLEKLVESFYKSFLEEYTTLVERNFSTFYRDFTLYQRMPLKCLIAVECENSPLPLVNFPDITVLSYTDRSLNQNTVILSNKQEIEKAKEKMPEDLSYYPIITERNFPLFQSTGGFMPFEIDRQRCTLRNQVYKSIKEDFKKAYAKFAAKHEV